MFRTRTFALALAVVIGLTSAACGGDDESSDDADVTTTETEDTETEAPDAEETDADAAAGPIEYAGDFDVVCTDGTGLGGATEYDPSAPGPHPIQIFEPSLGGSFITTSESLAEGWAPNVDDPSTTALVACLEVVSETPNGTTCEFDDEGATTSLPLVDATYDVTVYEATTADEVGTATIEATSTECPMFVSYDPSDPKYVNTPNDVQYEAALAEFVTP